MDLVPLHCSQSPRMSLAPDDGFIRCMMVVFLFRVLCRGDGLVLHSVVLNGGGVKLLHYGMVSYGVMVWCHGVLYCHIVEWCRVMNHSEPRDPRRYPVHSLKCASLLLDAVLRVPGIQVTRCHSAVHCSTLTDAWSIRHGSSVIVPVLD